MLSGPPRHPPFGGFGGRSVPRGVYAAHNACVTWSTRFVCKPRDGVAGVPGARVAKRALHGAWATDSRTQHDCRSRCLRAAHDHCTACQEKPSQPGAALALLDASAVTGGLWARRAAHHVRRPRRHVVALIVRLHPPPVYLPAVSTPEARSSRTTAFASSLTPGCVMHCGVATLRMISPWRRLATSP